MAWQQPLFYFLRFPPIIHRSTIVPCSLFTIPWDVLRSWPLSSPSYSEASSVTGTWLIKDYDDQSFSSQLDSKIINVPNAQNPSNSQINQEIKTGIQPISVRRKSLECSRSNNLLHTVFCFLSGDILSLENTNALLFWKQTWQVQCINNKNRSKTFDVCVTVHHWYNNTNSQLYAIIIIILLIISIISTCFGR